jgi:hypothetical protein
MESELGLGMESLRTRLDGDLLERLQRALLKPEARTYWENKMSTHEEQEASHRKEVEGETEDEATTRMARAEAERELVEDSRRRAGMSGLAHDVAHIMRLEFGDAKGYKWRPELATPWDGCGKLRSFAGRRAGIIDARLSMLDMGLEQGGGERAGAALWRALPEDMHSDVIPVLGELGLYRMGQLTTRDGARLSQWKRLQIDGVIPEYTGEARWYEIVRRALCGEEGHALEARWRVSAVPIKVDDFVIVSEGGDDYVDGTRGVGRVTGIYQGPGTSLDYNSELGGGYTTKKGWPVHLEKWIPTGQLPYSYRKTQWVVDEINKKRCAWVEGYAWKGSVNGQSIIGVYNG